MLRTKAEEMKNPLFLNAKTLRFTVGIINKGLIIPTEDWRPTSFGANDIDNTTKRQKFVSKKAKR
jgi:hypothetical protein